MIYSINSAIEQADKDQLNAFRDPDYRDMMCAKFNFKFIGHMNNMGIIEAHFECRKCKKQTFEPNKHRCKNG